MSEQNNIDFSTKILPGNPFANIVDNGAESARTTGALMTIAHELRTANIIQARLLEDGGLLDHKLAARMGIKVGEE